MRCFTSLLRTGLTGLCVAGVVGAGPELRPPRIPHPAPLRVEPRRDRTVKIAALRVQFAPDTLSTTTGDGRFDLGVSDTAYFDPPPHDSLYFADCLRFLRFYWLEMSGGALEIDTNWAIYPSGMDGAYDLPRQMWQYNYHRDPEQLNRGLAQLFRDAVTAADTTDDIPWSDWSLVIVFHAGAGAEFVVGDFDATPHDLPSAWMVESDFREYLGLPDGIPVDDGEGRVRGGLLLPETETRAGVQISMLGVMCSLFGHWLGLPALYDPEDGRPVVGKWSLMDRGFGNFYGAVPGELDGWSRQWMGWVQPLEAVSGRITLKTRRSLGAAAELVRIQATAGEAFFLECRNRDPERDRIAVAYDREGRRMVFREDYTVEAEAGFRVPVFIDNLDFDSPGSGILIWHFDSAAAGRIPEGWLNSFTGLQGLDLEEADGAQDIGQNYSFLTPGYGTDYGIFEDAWYRDNDAHRAANAGREVSFGDATFPDSRSNSGAYTHIVLSNFSGRDTVMTVNFQRTGYALDQPTPVAFSPLAVVAANFAGAVEDDEICLVGAEKAEFRQSDGNPLGTNEFNRDYSGEVVDLVSSDINGDGYNEVLWVTSDFGSSYKLLFLESSLFGGYRFALVDSFPRGGLFDDVRLAVGGPEENRLIFTAYTVDGSHGDFRVYDSGMNLVDYGTLGRAVAGIHRLGAPDHGAFLAVTTDGVIYRWEESVLRHLGGVIPEGETGVVLHTTVADFDASGGLDLVAVVGSGTAGEGRESLVFAKDVDQGDTLNWSGYSVAGMGNWRPFPMDTNGDGRYELVGYEGENGRIMARDYRGVAADRYPWRIEGQVVGSPSATDLNGDGREEIVTLESRVAEEGSPPGVVIRSYTGRVYDGYPIAARVRVKHSVPIRLSQPERLGLLLVSETAIDIVELAPGRPVVWWARPGRDLDNSGCVWEPATPFAPAAGASLMPEDLCYNWPNPAQGTTFIRYFLTAPADIEVNVYDLSGKRVAHFTGDGSPGWHHEITWNLTGVPRGAYIATVEARQGGRRETRQVKIAVW